MTANFAFTCGQTWCWGELFTLFILATNLIWNRARKLIMSPLHPPRDPLSPNFWREHCAMLPLHFTPGSIGIQTKKEGAIAGYSQDPWR